MGEEYLVKGITVDDLRLLLEFCPKVSAEADIRTCSYYYAYEDQWPHIKTDGRHSRFLRIYAWS
jgi:hypothetical protein